MLEEIDRLSEARTEFMFETTLATRTYARKIPLWKAAGYNVSLLYLRLPDVEHAILRVRRRLEEIYKPIVDAWYIWDSLEADFTLAESWDQA